MKNVLCIIIHKILLFLFCLYRFYNNCMKEKKIKFIKKYFKRNYKIKKIGDVDLVIGIKFIKNNYMYFIHQKKIKKRNLKKFNMNYKTPLRIKDLSLINELRNIKFNQTIYRSAICNLLYIAICTRPFMFKKWFIIYCIGNIIFWYFR